MLTRPRLVYDGDCAFCSRVAAWAADRLDDAADVVAWQRTDLAEVGLTVAMVTDAVQWVGGDDSIAAGHVAVARALSAMGGLWRVLGRLMLVPGLSWVAAGLYKVTARNRYRLPGGSPECRL